MPSLMVSYLTVSEISLSRDAQTDRQTESAPPPPVLTKNKMVKPYKHFQNHKVKVIGLTKFDDFIFNFCEKKKSIFIYLIFVTLFEGQGHSTEKVIFRPFVYLSPQQI